MEKEMTRQFLQLLDQNAEEFTFQIFDDKKERKDPRLARILHGSLDQHYDELRELNRMGGGIFVTVNETDLQGRRLENITRVRAIWQEDDDKADVPLLPFEPHMVVQSSPGKYHRYILVNDNGSALGQFREVMEVMVDQYGSDPNAKDLARVLRMPGFYHNKGESQMVKLIHESGAEPYSWDEVYQEFSIEHVEAEPEVLMQPEEAGRLEEALMMIPCSEMEYGEWLNIGMALHHETDGDQSGLELWDQWSRADEERYSDDCHVKWDSFGGNHSAVVTAGTIFYHARRYGYVPAVMDQVYSEHERPLTELGNAERIVDLHRGGLKYIRDEQQFRYYVDGKWKWIDGVEIAKMTIRTISAEAYHCKDDDRRIELIKHAMRSEKRSAIESALQLVKSEPAIYCDASEFDCDPVLMGLSNGIVDIRTGEFVDSNLGYLIRKELGCELNVGMMAPRWVKFINQISQGSGEMSRFLQTMAGYLLHDGNPEQKVFIFHGRGGNGKSTFVNVLEHILNDYCVTVAPSTLMETASGKTAGSARSDVVRLKGARAVFSQESSQGAFLDAAFIKMVSGGDTIVARQLYGKEQEFRPQFKLLLSTNHKPVIRENTDAVWSRLVTIPLLHNFRNDPNRIKDLDQMLIEQESVGILNWILEGYRMWRADGLVLPEEIQRDVAGYRTDQDIFGLWLEECCEVDSSNWSRSGTLYRSYQHWCQDEQGIRNPMTQRSFSMQLEERGFESQRKSSGRGWQGLRLAREPVVVGGEF